MLSPQKVPARLGFFVLLENLATPKHPLFILANQVKWRKFTFGFFQKNFVWGIETGFLRFD